jgi:dethiobiotin synthetase
MKFFVTAIGTDSGKTLVSAILCEALRADYWKPVQSGTPRDSDVVQSLLTNRDSKIHPERYCLTMPASPHAAAKHDGISIALKDFSLPETSNSIVIEGAGGCLVPLNEKDVVIDIASRLKTPVILVSNFYLGSINHTLLTFEALTARHLTIAGIVFNGDKNVESEKIILEKTGLKKLFHVPQALSIDKAYVSSFSQQVKNILS